MDIFLNYFLQLHSTIDVQLHVDGILQHGAGEVFLRRAAGRPRAGDGDLHDPPTYPRRA